MSQEYWKSLEEKALGTNKIESVKDEINHKSSVQSFIEKDIESKTSSRRNFLKWCGFTFTSAAIATSCENPVKKAIPYLNKPEEITPGKASYYASTYFDGHEYSSILVKTREGRPIKIEPNTLSSITKTGSSARSQAHVLSLYDSEGRYHHPLKNEEKISWDTAHEQITSQLEKLSRQGKEITLVTNNIISPSLKKLIASFQEKYNTLNWISYEPMSASAILSANEKSFGKRVVPQYRFDQAKIIVGINADFLGTWLLPLDYTDQYVKNRRINDNNKGMSRHLQFESTMSLTGTNADERYVLKPSEEGVFLANLYNEIAALSGYNQLPAAKTTLPAKEVAKELVYHKGHALVVCGTNNASHQVIVNGINEMLDAYGHTIHISQPLQTKTTNDNDFTEALHNHPGALLFADVNPVYDYPESAKVLEAIKHADLTVTFTTSGSETAKATQFVLPLHHPLESWGDFEPVKGKFSLAQPTIRPIYDTRQLEDILLKWTNANMDAHQYLQDFWENEMFPQQMKHLTFYDFWTNTLQNGVFEPAFADTETNNYKDTGVKEAFAKAATTRSSGTELIFYEKIGIGNGRYANNPWLQELPDPVTKATWDNYFSVSPSFAHQHQLKNDQVIRVKGIELPILIQPGQAPDTIAVAVGYGRENTGKVADGVGKNVYPLMHFTDGHRNPFLADITFESMGTLHPIATTQTHHSMEGRDIVRETSLEDYVKDPKSIKQKKHDTTLYKERKYEGHHWALVIDLNACTGCGACAVACQSENNVPVVGKDEVIKKRIMHWIRIDRYYKADEDNPQTVHQPLMCQHCDDAPCENVCPVAATTHSNEGINQMSYNRCIGTKYCINNCPYKVRRFNWYKYADNEKFDYNTTDELGRMVLNPDVTVRSRGVVEKCSFCVQRIQEAKEKAKLENRPLKDGDIVPACAQTCPANALVFGDLNDPESRVSKMVKSNRNYHLLEEIHTKPSVSYLAKVRNMGAKTDA